MLQKVVFVWRSYRDVFVKFCSKLFSYLVSPPYHLLIVKDRFYVITASKNSLKTEAYRLFKSIIFDVIKPKLRTVILNQIQQDREQSTSSNVDRSLLKDTLFVRNIIIVIITHLLAVSGYGGHM